MHNRIITALCTLMAWAPAALAQEEGPVTDDTAGEMGEAGEVGGLEVSPPQGDRVRMPDGNATAPGQVHTVVKGDTLWDLSQSYLGSPWYWPKVWSYNPEIANPHWIYPGNKVRFFPSGEEVPARVEVVNAPSEIPSDTIVPAYMESDEGTVELAGQIGYQPRNAGRIQLQGFVTTRELDEAGRIAGSFAESKMLSFPDTIYIQFKNRGDVQVGSEYVIFRTAEEIEHPVTGADVGFLTHFLGKARVIKMDGEFVTAQITDTWDAIERGDLIGPVNENLMVNLTPRPNDRQLTGHIVVPLVPAQTMVGEHQLVVVDKGSSDGVQVGNTFTVVRQQDFGGTLMSPKDGQESKWPTESIATCLVVDTKDKMSTCILTRSIREVVPGDRIVMQPSAPVAMSVR